MTSSPTPPLSSTMATIRPIRLLFTPPRLGLHTPGTASSLVKRAASSAAAVEPSVVTFSESGTPGCVRRAGGSIVRMDSSFRPLPWLSPSRSLSLSYSRPMEMARTASATAISSRVGSKMMLSPTEMTRRVTGGRTGCVNDGVVVVDVGSFPFAVAVAVALGERG
ncbi:hypothetical protein VTN02DRAFT_5723 [Thermoascus thermophilus]